MSFRDFLKEHWYLLTTGLIFLVVLIVSIIGGFIKINPSSPVSLTNCQPPSNVSTPISEISIGSNTSPCNNNYCCPNGYSPIPIKGGNNNNIYLNQYIGGTPYSQVCTIPATDVCDQTAVVTDMKLVDMTDSTGGTAHYADLPNRCCTGPNDSNCVYYPPLEVALPNPSSQDVGILPNSVNNCAKMGLCVTKQTMGNIKATKGTYLPLNNIQFAISDDVTTDPNTVCANTVGTGYVTDGNNLYKNCSGNKALYLCKKFISV